MSPADKTRCYRDLERRFNDCQRELDVRREQIEALEPLADEDYRRRFVTCKECRSVNDMDSPDGAAGAGDGQFYCWSCVTLLDTSGNVVSGTIFERELC